MKLDDMLYKGPGTGYLMLDAGILMITGEFTQERIMPVTRAIMEYNLLPKELQPEYITLIINSPGGSMYACYHLIDIIKTSKIPIHTVAQGLVASAGLLTLMAGEKGHRSATHNTSIMSHTWSSGSRGTSHDLEAINKEYDLANSRMIEHYKKCTGKSETYIKSKLVGPMDTWMSAEEAVKHGIIDTVKDTY